LILPDVNVLVYAFRREALRHEQYAAWLADVVAGEDELALHDTSLSGFVRIVTNPRVVPTPAPTPLALEFVTRLRAARRSRWVGSSDPSWTRLGRLVQADRGLAGNLVPDAHLAALALAHGCRVATADRGFARFPGLDWFDPAA
jgi:toxin-antitoxin system PIN domain toxin